MTFNHSTGISFFNSKFSGYLFFFGILAVGIFLRLYKLDFKSMWLDELYSIVPVNPDNSVSFIVNHCKADQPPFYFLLLHYWFKLTPYTSISGRLLSSILGIFGIIAIYFLGKEINNQRTGLFASFLTAINFYHIYYSQELRFYSLLFLLTVLSFHFFIRSIKKQDLASYALYTLSTIALLYTQYFGMLVFAIQGAIFVIYVIYYREKMSFILTGIFLASLIAASFTPWLPTVLYDSQIEAYWVPTPKPYFFAVYYYLYWGKDVFTALLLLATGALYLLWVYKGIQHRTITRNQVLIAIILVSWIVLSYALPYIRSVISTPMLQPRYTLVTLPAILLVIALGFDRITRTNVRTLVITLTVIATAMNLFIIQKHYTMHDKAQWREAAQVVIEEHEPGVKVYSNLEWWYNYFFYSTNPPIRVLGKYASDDQEQLQRFIEQMQNEEQFWVLNGEGAMGLTAMQQAYVDAHYEVAKRYDFFAASAVLYQKKRA